MKSEPEPLVSIITPVHNGGRYIEECVQSILSQTYTNLEYFIVSNCSTDATLSIAKRYEAIDKRIRVYDYSEFVDVIESHNRAFRLISSGSKYCKVVSSDDCLFPECIARMVALAEANPTVGIVGSYALSGGSEGCRVVFDGLPYGRTIVSGREACRWHLLGGRYFLGMPTSVMYRSDLVRGTDSFYPNPRQHADISAFYECLRTSDFGFVHQVLAYERVHQNALGAKAKPLSSSAASHLPGGQRREPGPPARILEPARPRGADLTLRPLPQRRRHPGARRAAGSARTRRGPAGCGDGHHAAAQCDRGRAGRSSRPGPGRLSRAIWSSRPALPPCCATG